MKSSGKPDAGNLHVRFDEGDGRMHTYGHPYSTVYLWFLPLPATEKPERNHR
jgi:hypothetical protein